MFYLRINKTILKLTLKPKSVINAQKLPLAKFKTDKQVWQVEGIRPGKCWDWNN